MGRISINDILELPTAERVEIVQKIWDSLAANPEAVPVTDAQKKELDRRLAAFENDPEAGESWEEVKKSLRGE